MIWTANIALQGPATTQAPQTNAGANPDRNVFTKEELQTLRDQVRQNVRAQIAGATEGAAAHDVAPTPPAPPRTFTIHGSNGQTTVIDVPAGFNARNVIPQQVVDISIAFFLTMAFIIVGLPLARAFARRLDRRGAGSAQVPGEVTAQLTQLNHAVDAIALEVERISEGQRFTTRLLSEQRDASSQTLPSRADR
ncbi:MAG: hypothetical protein QOD47_638 [Gemmatimonadaceae bacterium]|jgi:hypothetical protein|nr:hypothetical protein [Gemmatimonadaceae bacterium]